MQYRTTGIAENHFDTLITQRTDKYFRASQFHPDDLLYSATGH